jgi:hypothetical protein
MHVWHRWYFTAGVALVGAGVIAVSPVTAPLTGAHAQDIQLTAGDEPTDVVIDILRHGEREAPFNHLQIPSPPNPGPHLSDLGEQQAEDVAHKLFDKFGPVAGIFAGEGIRDQDTAAPFAALEAAHDNPADLQTLPGINEIDFGIYGLKPLTSFGGILSQMMVAVWALGFEAAPMPGSGQDPNGVIFDEKFTGAVNTMYDYATDHPVQSDTGDLTDVAFNNEGSVAAWVELNAKNPDFPFFLVRGIQSLINPDEHGILPPTGIIEIKGNPEDGWNLVSWDGHPIPQEPGLLTSLLADFREPIIAFNQALWHIWDAILCSGSDFTCIDPTEIQDQLQGSVQNLGETLLHFPGAVFNDFAAALTNPGSAFGDIVDAVQYLADTSGQGAGEAAATVSDAGAAWF